MSIDLTGKNKFAWFVLHAEAESGVVEGFKVQGAVQPGGPTVAGGSGTFTLAVVRARSKPTYASIDNIEEEELLGTHVHVDGVKLLQPIREPILQMGFF